VEGSSGVVFGLCVFGGGDGGWCYGVGAEVCGAGDCVADALYGGCECDRKRAGYVEVCYLEL
jgi:hypothetical protein